MKIFDEFKKLITGLIVLLGICILAFTGVQTAIFLGFKGMIGVVILLIAYMIGTFVKES